MYKVKDIFTKNGYVVAITEDNKEIPFIQVIEGKIRRLKHYNVLYIPIELHEKVTRLIQQLK